MRRLFSESLWVASGQACGVLGTIAVLKLTVSWLDASEYGRFALGQGVIVAMCIALFGPLSQVWLRFFPVLRERGLLLAMRGELARSTVYVSLLGVLLLCVGATAMAVTRGSEWLTLLVAAGLSGIAGGLNMTWGAVLNAARQRRAAALLVGGEPWLRLSGAALAGAGLGWSATHLLIGYGLGSAVLAVFGGLRAFPLLTDGGPAATAESLAEIRQRAMAYALPFLVFGLCAAVVPLDRWVVESVLSLEAAGRYAAVLQIAGAPTGLLVTVLGWIVAPMVFDSHEKKEGHFRARRLIGHSVVVYFLLCLPMLAVCLWADRWLVGLLTNATVADSASLLWVMFLGMALFQMGQLLVTEGLRLMRPEQYIGPKLWHAATLLLACWWLAGRWALNGAAWALVLSSLVYLMSVMRANRRAANP